MSFIPNSNAVEGPVQYDFQADRGWTIVRNFKGGQSAIESKSDELIAAGYDVKIKEGPSWELQATVGVSGYGQTSGGGETPSDAWELQGNEIERHVLHSTISAVTALSSTNMSKLIDIFEKNVKKETVEASTAYFGATPTGDPWGLFNLNTIGTDSVYVIQPILRRTRTVTRAYQVPASLSGVGQVYSSARVIANENVPALIAGSMGASSSVLKPGANSTTITSYWSWYKCHPQIHIIARGQSQIVQEWRWGLWSSLLYTYNA